MSYLLVTLTQRSTSYILEKVKEEKTPQAKLHTFISASLAYQGTHPAHNAALLEIVFNARTPENVPYYKLDDGEDDPIMHELQQILQDGQEQGLFGNFHAAVMANFIQGAIGEYMFNHALVKEIDLEMYSDELIRIVDKAVKQEGGTR